MKFDDGQDWKVRRMVNGNIEDRGNTDFRVSVSEKLQELRKELQKREREIKQLQFEQAQTAESIAHLEGFLKSTSNERNSNRKPVHRPVHRRTSYGKVGDMVARVLAERSPEQVHYKELADEVQRRGIEIHGADPGANLVNKIFRDPRFVRPERRGYYALRKDYPDARNVGERKRVEPTQWNADQGSANESK